jgi:hypothetical protein
MLSPHTVEEEYKLRVSKNKGMMILGPKRDDVIDEWKKFHNENLKICPIYLLFLTS